MVWYVHVQRTDAGPPVHAAGRQAQADRRRAKVGRSGRSSATRSIATSTRAWMCVERPQASCSSMNAPCRRLGGHEGTDPPESTRRLVTVFVDTAVAHVRQGRASASRSVPDGSSTRSATAMLDGGHVGRGDPRDPPSVHRDPTGRRWHRPGGPRNGPFAPVLPITHALMRRVPDLVARYPSLDSRDLVHVATCINEGITDIVSAGSWLRSGRGGPPDRPDVVRVRPA